MLLRNACWLSTGYTTLYPRRRTLHSHGREELKSFSFSLWNFSLHAVSYIFCTVGSYRLETTEKFSVN
jgi:hypothetical protein